MDKRVRTGNCRRPRSHLGGHSPMPTRFALALALIALAILAVYGDLIVVTFYVLDATRVLPFWQVATILGLVGLVLAYRPSSD